MAFDANRDIKIEASEGAPGSFVLRTKGLADRRRPELEIAGVPERGLNAAAGVINAVAGYTVNEAEILADQSVGIVVSVGDDGRKLLLAVRAVASEKPRSGLWSKLAGSGKGVLRLVDVDAAPGEMHAPRTALATMLVHRAAVRSAQKDDDGARAELATALEILPGQPGAGAAPLLGGTEGALNWQNHLAYLDLAALEARAGEAHQAATLYGAALARSPELTRRELGTTFEALASFDPETVETEARLIVEHNLSAMHRGPGPAPALVTVASPIWELTMGEDGELVARRASLVPAAILDLYYEGLAAEGLRRAGAQLVTKIVGGGGEAPWRAAWIARETRAVWVSEEAPLLEPIGPARAVHGVVSSVLADVARCFRAGADDAEILARYAGTPSEALEDKLARLAMWESEHYLKAMSV